MLTKLLEGPDFVKQVYTHVRDPAVSNLWDATNILEYPKGALALGFPSQKPSETLTLTVTVSRSLLPGNSVTGHKRLNPWYEDKRSLSLSALRVRILILVCRELGERRVHQIRMETALSAVLPTTKAVLFQLEGY